MTKIFAYLIAWLIFIGELYIIAYSAEYLWCAFHNQIPFVRSSKYLRRALVSEIQRHFPDTTSVCDIGAGYGGLARYIARHCNVSVIALENMPFSLAVAYIMNLLSHSRVQIVKCDAFEYLKSSPRLDIGVAYLGPGVNNRLAEYKKQFDAIITFDVPIDKFKPTRVINVGHGVTRYGRHRYPHKLFVYDFRK